MVCAQTSSVISRLAPRGLIPALFTRMSAGPERATCAKAAAMLPGSATSQLIASAWPPASRIWATVCAAPAALTSSTLTRAPTPASVCATARPRPLAAPVTTACRPARSTRGPVMPRARAPR